jgi:hypothetical protein
LIARASGFGIGVGRFSRQLRGVGVIALPNAGLDTTRCIEVPPSDGVLQLLVTGVEVGIFIDRPYEADGVEVTR